VSDLEEIDYESLAIEALTRATGSDWGDQFSRADLMQAQVWATLHLARVTQRRPV